MKKSFYAILVIVALISACNPGPSSPTSTDNVDTTTTVTDTNSNSATQDTLNQ